MARWLVQTFTQLRKGFPGKVDACTCSDSTSRPPTSRTSSRSLRFLGLIDEDGSRVQDTTGYFFGNDDSFKSGLEDTLRRAYSHVFDEMGDGALDAPKDDLTHWFRASDKTSSVVGGRCQRTVLASALRAQALAIYGNPGLVLSDAKRETSMLDDTRHGWKKEAKARCHEIVERTADGQLVSDEDAEFLHWLLDRHPGAAEKIGVGVAAFTVEAIGMATRGFMLHRFDGSSTDFSYYKCITSPSAVGLARKAMRRAVAGQVIEFKQAAAARGSLVCAVTGEILDWNGAHVDHAPPIFVTLADEWAERVGGYTAIQLLPAKDGELGRCMADPEPWAAFHQDRAKLRIVARLTNLSLLQRGGRSARPSA